MNQELMALEQRMSSDGRRADARRSKSIPTRARARRASATSDVRDRARARSRRARRSEGQDSALQPDDAGARDGAHDKESDEGLHALERVVAEDPKVIDAWFMLGNEYHRRRQFTRAIEQFKRALRPEA